MTPNTHLIKDDGDLFDDLERDRKLVGKLNSLSLILMLHMQSSQFMSTLVISHWTTLEQMLWYLKGAPRLGIFY